MIENKINNMKKKVLAILKKDQMNPLEKAAITSTLLKAKLIAMSNEVEFREVESSPVGAANLATALKVECMCYIKLKSGTMDALIKKINETCRATPRHLILCPDGPPRKLTEMGNVSVYQTMEELESSKPITVQVAATAN